MAGSRRKRKAVVAQSGCVACGCCVKVCPIGAIEVIRGLYARRSGDISSPAICVGCGRCAKECPASVIEIREESV